MKFWIWMKINYSCVSWCPGWSLDEDLDIPEKCQKWQNLPKIKFVKTSTNFKIWNCNFKISKNEISKFDIWNLALLSDVRASLFSLFVFWRLPIADVGAAALHWCGEAALFALVPHLREGDKREGLSDWGSFLQLRWPGAKSCKHIVFQASRIDRVSWDFF